MTTRQNYKIDIEKLQKKKSKHGYTWNEIEELTGITKSRLINVIRFQEITGVGDYITLNEWIHSKDDTERVEYERKRKIEKEQNIISTFHSRLKGEQKKLEEIKKTILFKDIQYVTKASADNYKRKTDIGSFVRVNPETELNDIDDWYYRYPREIEVAGFSFNVTKETSIKSYKQSILDKDILIDLFKDNSIEVFMKVG